MNSNSLNQETLEDLISQIKCNMPDMTYKHLYNIDDENEVTFSEIRKIKKPDIFNDIEDFLYKENNYQYIIELESKLNEYQIDFFNEHSSIKLKPKLQEMNFIELLISLNPNCEQFILTDNSREEYLNEIKKNYSINEYTVIQERVNLFFKGRIVETVSKRELTIIELLHLTINEEKYKSKYSSFGSVFENIKIASTKINQQTLDNSYNAIIKTIKKDFNNEHLIKLIEYEKETNLNLFTKPNKYKELKKNNHYMDFLYGCITKNYNGQRVFYEFVISMIRAYKLYFYVLKNKDKEKKLKNAILTIQSIDDKLINITNEYRALLIPTKYQKYIPFLVLSKKLSISDNKLFNYYNAVREKENTNKNQNTSKSAYLKFIKSTEANSFIVNL
jgi:hypothetical protein